MNNVELKDSYWASVSGGKDSLYMFRLILENPKKYPLNGVVHFELEIDYPWVKDVINHYEKWCKQLGIPFIRIKPRKIYKELLDKYDLPHRLARWCNSEYKMDCRKQFEEHYKNISNVHWYIGICADESNRCKDQIYPLVEEGIHETDILKWASNIDLFNNFYKNCDRQGCMYCPCMGRKELAYIKKYYPDNFNFFIEKIREYESKHGNYFNSKQDIDNVLRNIEKKWDSKIV